MYTYKDYFQTYGRIMQFNKNKTEPFHRWYPFVEGYSREFIKSIIDEMGKDSMVCLEPFSGSGTTALELQNSGIKCYSFEVNPLMYLIARVKLEKSYTVNDLRKWFLYVCNERQTIKISEPTSDFKTLYENGNTKKWNYHSEVSVAIKKLEMAIGTVSDEKYKELLKVALASILLEVSNLYRNGKCLSYKKDWENKSLSEQEVFNRFDNKVRNELMEDIEKNLLNTSINNKESLYNIDSRVGIEEKIDNDSIDLVITSPPYLNSRDYTDTYMLELKTLGFTKNSDEIKALRKKTLRSHVQIKWSDETNVENKLLQETMKKLNDGAKLENMWNNSILDMVRLYFVDMQALFDVIYRKLKVGGRIYFYMFYYNDMTKEQVEEDIKSKLNELKSTLSPSFFSIYKHTITNDMKYWGY